MKPKVAFICVHNSCRSQMADAEFIKTARIIEEKVKDLKIRIENKEIDLESKMSY